MPRMLDFARWSDRSVLAAVLAVAFAVRLAACVVWVDELTVDRDAYLGMARTIADGQGLCQPRTTRPTAYRPPVYPLLLALGLLGTSPAVAVAAVNIAAGLVAVSGTYALARRWMPGMPWAPAVASLVVSLDPLLVRYTAQPMTEGVFTAVSVWMLYGLATTWDAAGEATNSPGSSFFVGVLGGVAALCRPTILPFAGFMSLALLLTALRRGQSSRLPTASAFIAGGLVMLGAWGMRNQAVLGHPIITTTHGGYTLLLANNRVFFDEVARQPWGAVWSHDSLVHWQESLNAEMDRTLGSAAGEVAQDRWQAARARAEIARDPSGFTAAVWYRLRSFWSLAPRGDGSASFILNSIVGIWYAALFAAAVCGLWRWRFAQPGAAWLGVAFVATIAAVHLAYWTDTRMRAPLHPVLATWAAAAVARRH